MRRFIFLFAVILVVFAGCKNKSTFSLKGSIRGETRNYIYLHRLDVNTPILVDSAKISKGSFSFRIKAKEPEFYQLGFKNNDFITLLAGPGEKIRITFNGKNLIDGYSIKGSEESEKIRLLDMNLVRTRKTLDSLSNLYSKEAGLAAFDKRGPALEEQFRSVMKEQRRKNIAFIINNVRNLSAIKALYQKIDDNTYVLYDRKDLQYLKIVTDSLTKYYPGSKQVQALASNFSREMSQMYSSQLQAMTKDLPETKLDPNLLTTRGNRVALSSLKGKFVLLTFWSVNSSDCIQENLLLKEYYRLYNKKGFDIYQINLDNNEAAWKAAVKFDELPWISAREDDSTNLINARLFNVRNLPTNYLFDKEGKIVAVNLHGKQLQLKLEQLFK